MSSYVNKHPSDCVVRALSDGPLDSCAPNILCRPRDLSRTGSCPAYAAGANTVPAFHFLQNFASLGTGMHRRGRQRLPMFGHTGLAADDQELVVYAAHSKHDLFIKGRLPYFATISGAISPPLFVDVHITEGHISQGEKHFEYKLSLKSRTHP